MISSREIRQQYIDFFVKRHGHTFVPSAPVVPHDDPTLLFTNAGMNQFKPIFLGQETRAYTRAANTQKCIRAGGKHNDLDDVGRSRRHGTFFEMLGNWSFGDYFKRGAIEMAWELMTKVWKMDPSRLHVTVFEGDEKNGVPRDTEAANLWKEIAGIPDERIHYFGAKDNFWEMGDTGPCGPCTEINIDKRPQSEIDADRKAGRKAPVNGEDPRVMEFWNLVFIQYNRTWKSGGADAVRAFDTVRVEPRPGEDAEEARRRTRLEKFGIANRAEMMGTHTSLDVLPAQHVDTGMGFERICSILQDKDDMYGIDLFDPFFSALSELSGFKYSGLFPPTNAPDPAAEAASPELRHDIAFRVIADHMRTLTFAIADGAVPSNEGRGYVLRRILRRAVRFGRQQLELRDPFMHKLVPVVVDAMGHAFPEISEKRSQIEDIVRDEEISFGKTLDRGIALFEMKAGRAAIDAIAKPGAFSVLVDTDREIPIMLPEENSLEDIDLGVSTKIAIWDSRTGAKNLWAGRISDLSAEVLAKFAPAIPVIRADAAFKLHDTYGFPIDLTRIMAEERGMSVDIAGYEKLMEQARELARAGGKAGASKVFTVSPDALAELAKQNVKPTDDSAKFSREPIDATVMAIWNGDDLGLSPADAFDDEELAIILDRTNFYAEMGGQVGDSGVIHSSSAQFDVQTTRVVGAYVLHIGRVRNGKMRVGDKVKLTVARQREATEKNHTTTHLANWALRDVLGDAVQQKGSLVDPEKLRFDFSHGKAMSDDEIARVETLVNERIAKPQAVYAEIAPQEQALKINGLRAVFGEKYPPMVRVVSIGVPVNDLLSDPTNKKWREYSIEFCGGTHLRSSGDAKQFVITAEEAISKGIRRLVALTGANGEVASAAGCSVDQLIDRANKTPDPELPSAISSIQKSLETDRIPLRAKRRAQSAIAALQAKHKAWQKSNQSSSAKIDVAAVASDLLSKANDLILVAEVSGATEDNLRGIIDSLKKRSGSIAVLLATVVGEKVAFVSAVSDDLIAKGLKAGDWIRATAKVAGGGGGGSPQMAQAGGKDPSKLAEALATARDVAAAALK